MILASAAMESGKFRKRSISGISSKTAAPLFVDRIDALAEVDGRRNLNIFGYVDEDGDGEIGYESTHFLSTTWHYRTYGMATLPGISVDNNGNIAIIFNVMSEVRINQENDFYFRSAWVTCKDSQNNWWLDENGINLAEDFVHEYEEQYASTASAKAYNGTFWVMYSGDDAQGLYLDISETYPNSNGGGLTENYIYAIKVVPAFPGWDGIEEQEVINPMTATRVYPNPATDVLNIEVNASQASEMSINVFNLMGQKVMEKNVTLSTGINTPSISTSDLTSGIYFVTVKANGFENTMKFIVKYVSL